MKLILLVLFLPLLSLYSQSILDKEIREYSCSSEKQQAVREYFEEFKATQEFILNCEIETEKRWKTSNQSKPIKISGFSPNTVSLVKPYYPTIAKELKFSDIVLIEVLIDEKGFVISSKPLRGQAMFYQSARKAACKSQFRPIIYCEKSIKSRWLIQYNFLFR